MRNLFAKIEHLAELKSIFRGPEYEKARAAAFEENPWFTPQMIDHASAAICDEMLNWSKLRAWLSDYQLAPDFVPKRVGIVAAGNIPMVGLFDVLCAVVTGHSVSLKLSSKDRVMMEYVVAHLDAEIEIVNQMDRYDIDYLIATGSDRTAQYFATHFQGIRCVIRGARHSVALLNGRETDDQIRGLNDDLFLYFGMGCRNVSHIFVPQGYNVRTLAAKLHPYAGEAFEQKVKYEKALAAMLNEPQIEGRSFMMREQSINTISPVGVIGYSYYTETPDLNPNTIQCTVGIPQLPVNVEFGTTQSPRLDNYPDRVDIISFLTRL